MALKGSTNAEKIWNYCIAKGLNAYGASGLMANLDAESGLNPQNLQDSYQTKLGFTDATYTAAVDSGSYSKEQFIHDSAGYSLAQWTYWTRKQALYEYAKATYRSIGDLEMALDFLFIELNDSYKLVLNALKSVTSVRKASDEVMLKFECPADTSEQARARRASIGQEYYSRFAASINTGGVNSMGYFTCTKGQVVRLSPHFVSTEFDCHGSGCCSETKVNELLLDYLENIRTHFDAPITVTSSFRCPVHNRNIGSGTGSRHVSGDAADIVVKGVSPREVAKYAESIGIKGIGLYETDKDGHFVHIDTRTAEAFWYGQGQAYRATFGGSSASNTSGGDAASNSNTSFILDLGDKSDDVKKMQEKLNKLGCYCGAADGVFGKNTEKAVKKFQVEYGNGTLVVDGIAGYQTLSVIDKAIKELDNGEKVKVTANVLNVRSGAGMNFPVVSTVKSGTVCVLIEEKDGWGKIRNPSGWISMEYAKKV